MNAVYKKQSMVQNAQRQCHRKWESKASVLSHAYAKIKGGTVQCCTLGGRKFIMMYLEICIENIISEP